MTTRSRPLAFALAALAGFAGCRPRDGQPTLAAAQPTVVTLTATDYAFQTSDTLAAGWTTFRLVNHGTQPHMGQLVRLEPGMTPEDFLTAYAEAFRSKGPRPEWARRLGGPGAAFPQQTTNATLYLEPGRYVWICLFDQPDGIPHVVGHGMAKPFLVGTVGAGVGPEIPPQHDAVLRLADYSFHLAAPLSAGRHMIRVENAGAESHEVAVLRLAPGRTLADVRAWIQNPGAAPMESLGNLSGGVSSLAPGAEAYFEADLPAGDYVLLCFVTARDGRSHIDHGMIQQIRVG